MEMRALKLRLAQSEQELQIMKKQLNLIQKFLLGWQGGLDLSRRLLAIEKEGDTNAE